MNEQTDNSNNNDTDTTQVSNKGSETQSIPSADDLKKEATKFYEISKAYIIDRFSRDETEVK